MTMADGLSFIRVLQDTISKSPTMITQWSESCSSYGKSTKSSPLILSSPMKPCQQARKAFDKGIECILRTQVRQNGELTVWCAQHDRITLEPCKARAYELPSLSGQESDNIVLLLMSLPHPSEKVIESIESAVKWFKDSGNKRNTKRILHQQ